ncbi:ABC transporter permease [Flammeovirga pectinis]|uniref:ABC transporter permease n=1 Tax=Flammeovirga pectinis TaxID=2494373 RepID=A0A3S9P249_9BACT|nr:ABC transporter permease [Flammeovirga pectinis]AZQ62258.1 ABC transporter permease [Flammeovirga pectinis]
MKALLQIIKREFKLFFSNNVLLAVFFGAPIFFGILIGYTYQQASVKNLSIAVIDQDNSPLSSSIIDALDENFYLSVDKVTADDKDLKKDLPSFEAIVRIPEGFEGDVNYKRHPHIQIEVNGANMITGNYANIGIRTVLGTINAGAEIVSLQKQGIPFETAKEQWEVFAIDNSRYFNGTSNYLLFMLPGVMGAVMQQVFLLGLALTFSYEHENKTFGELSKITKNPFIVFLGKAIPYWVLGMFLWGVIQVTLLPFFKIPTPTNISALLITTSVFILSLTCLGMLVSWIVPSQLKATEALMVVSTPSFILSGFTWPLEAMPAWIQAFSNCIPLTYFLQALRKLINYDTSLGDLTYQLNSMLIISLITGVATLILITLKLNKKPVNK